MIRESRVAKCTMNAYHVPFGNSEWPPGKNNDTTVDGRNLHHLGWLIPYNGASSKFSLQPPNYTQHCKSRTRSILHQVATLKFRELMCHTQSFTTSQNLFPCLLLTITIFLTPFQLKYRFHRLGYKTPATMAILMLYGYGAPIIDPSCPTCCWRAPCLMRTVPAAIE